ncbi:metal-dependent transcriptional regulator [Homoserinimonas hongtaonis]|uniref:Manganese transport regulator n=1 Tax=Homoserinimonas hongtaonis TaxID=2079791 RepID=A0A2U1SX41_9MICO|nr:metal-dependent transcriptional regulator [Salinibacterium hongtaonis]AWB90517.1 DtxR family transcriptional regulator [Salinibacterium hongtaonis]PWB96152.1 metal-dependent transcriptional regulator [Salinibacterium hongtaonis]
MPATSVVEDYVKTIYAYTEWQNAPVTPSALAARLGLAASSVTEMVKKLAAADLVNHVPYGAVTLTDEGRMLAVRMVRRHRLIETWLVESFGYGWDEVHDEAEVLEHAISDRLLDAIYEQLGRPRRDPHGDPIPAPDGSVTIPDAIALAQAPEGHVGRVLRISDRNPMLLRHLAAEGVAVDSDVVVVGRKPFGGSLTVRLGAAELDLGDEAASAIWVSA